MNNNEFIVKYERLNMLETPNTPSDLKQYYDDTVRPHYTWWQRKEQILDTTVDYNHKLLIGNGHIQYNIQTSYDNRLQKIWLIRSKHNRDTFNKNKNQVWQVIYASLSRHIQCKIIYAISLKGETRHLLEILVWYIAASQIHIRKVLAVKMVSQKLSDDIYMHFE